MDAPPTKATDTTPLTVAGTDTKELASTFTTLHYDYRMEFMASFSTVWKKHWGDFCGVDTVSLQSEQLVGLGAMHMPNPNARDNTYDTIDNQMATAVIQVFNQTCLLHQTGLLELMSSEWPRIHPRSSNPAVAARHGAVRQTEGGNHGSVCESSPESRFFPGMARCCKVNSLSFKDGRWHTDERAKLDMQATYLMLLDAIFPNCHFGFSAIIK